MEQWQISHIKNNLVELIKNTKCSTIFIAILSSKRIIAEPDCDELNELHQQRFKQNRVMYEMLMTRRNSFELLVEALEETCQTGALKILRQSAPVYQNHGLISFNINHVLIRRQTGTTIFKGKFDGRDVAVKRVNSDAIDLDKAVKEVEFLKILDFHESIIRYFYAERDENYYYIALEVFEINLQNQILMGQMVMPPNDILEKCTSGILHLHKHNIIHRDLRPANIIINKHNQVKIFDFGLSEQIPDGDASITVTGADGSSDWVAPEILKSLVQDFPEYQQIQMTKSSDIFSLGCIFYFVLTNGSHPFGNPGDRQHHILHNRPQLEKAKTLSMEHLYNQIRRMISHSPNNRPSIENVFPPGYSKIKLKKD